MNSGHEEVDTRPDPGRRLRQSDQAHHGAVAEADGNGPGNSQGVFVARPVDTSANTRITPRQPVSTSGDPRPVVVDSTEF